MEMEQGVSEEVKWKMGWSLLWGLKLKSLTRFTLSRGVPKVHRRARFHAGSIAFKKGLLTGRSICIIVNTHQSCTQV